MRCRRAVTTTPRSSGFWGLGARTLEHDWGKLNWTVMLDPGNNEFCLLKPTN